MADLTARDLRWACALALLAFGVFNANGREIPSYDSQPSKYLAIEIAQHHTLTLDATIARIPQLGERSGFATDLHGHRRSAYPLPSALAAGAVAWILSACGLLDLGTPLAPNLVAKVTASLLAALTVAAVFLYARRRLGVRQALFIALGFGLGTNMWAGVSQTLWQQETALAACIAAIVLIDLPASVVPSVWRLLIAGALLGITGWARFQLAATIVLLAAVVVFRWRWRAGWCLVPLALFGCLAMAINIAWFGHALGALPALELLHASVHDVTSSVSTTPWTAAAGLLVSPSRGLLIFSPVVAVAFAGIRAAFRDGAKGLLPWCLGAVAAQFVLYSTYSVWWAGHTYGPRYTLDLLPALVPLATAGYAVVAQRRWTQAVTAVALAWSMLVAGTGAFVYPAEAWNTSPIEVDRHHERLWDWRDSQIARALHTHPSPQNFGLFSK